MLFLKEAPDELIVGYRVAKLNDDDSHGSLRLHPAIHVLRIHLEVIRRT